MQNVVIEEPYEFIPPVYSRLWPVFIRRFLVPPFLRKAHGVHSIETRGAERLKASLDAGHAAILAPNHCRMSDPLTPRPIVPEPDVPVPPNPDVPEPLLPDPLPQEQVRHRRAPGDRVPTS